MLDTNGNFNKNLDLLTFADEIQRLTYELTRYYGFCDRYCVEKLDITAAQGYILLAMPEQDGLTMNDLSNRMKLANSTMTRMVDPLCKKELLVRQSDPEDRRIVLVRLTEAGRKIKENLKGTFQEFFMLVVEDIAEGERESLAKGLRTLNGSVLKALQGCCGLE